MQRDGFGLLVGGVEKELGLCFLLPLWHRIRGCVQDVINFLCQGCDVIRQVLPLKTNEINMTHNLFYTIY